MSHAPAGRHPVDLAGSDRLQRAQAVAVQDLARQQVGDRRQADVRVRSVVEPVTQQELGRADLIEEDEQAHHLPPRGRQRAARRSRRCRGRAARSGTGCAGLPQGFRSGDRD
jgi:hypothetical protein